MTEIPAIMSPERFSALAAAYGAAMETWPAPERQAGRVFALTPQGQLILRQAGRLDSVLAGIGGHWCIRFDKDRLGSGSAASAVGSVSRQASPRRSRSDKLEALLSGSGTHAR